MPDNNIKNLMNYYEDNPNASKLEWIKLLDKTVRAWSDDEEKQELGKVEAINKDHLVVKKGPIPHSYLKGIDGNEILLKLTRSESESFRRDNKTPNPANYTTYGGSISHRAYPQVPYMPRGMLRDNVRNVKRKRNKN